MANPNPPKPAVLYAPVIGFLNLLGDQGTPLLEEDRGALAPMFRASVTSSAEYPFCQVLFLYCTIGDDGRLVGAKDNLPDMIKACGARLAVLASPNRPDALVKLAPTKNDWAASTVLTMSRNGDKFTRFFHKIFDAMFAGTPLGMAWVRLAPQLPKGMVNPLGDENPATIMLGGLINFVFGADWYPCKTGPTASEIASVADKLLEFLRGEYGDKGGLHAPSFFSTLGSVLGFSVHESIVRGGYVTDELLQYKNFLLTLTAPDGRKYWAGDLINMLLFEAKQGRVSAWTFIAAAVARDGTTPPDFLPIVRHVIRTLGTPEFGIPTLPPEHMPREMPMVALKRLWPSVRQILERGQRPPKGWPIDVGWIAAQAIERTPTLPRALAARILMEAAIPMSKLR